MFHVAFHIINAHNASHMDTSWDRLMISLFTNREHKWMDVRTKRQKSSLLANVKYPNFLSPFQMIIFTFIKFFYIWSTLSSPVAFDTAIKGWRIRVPSRVSLMRWDKLEIWKAAILALPLELFYMLTLKFLQNIEEEYNTVTTSSFMSK